MYAVGWTPRPGDRPDLRPVRRRRRLQYALASGLGVDTDSRFSSGGLWYDGTEILAAGAGSDGAYIYRITPAIGDVSPIGDLGTFTPFEADVLPVDSTGMALIHLIRAAGAHTYYALFNGAKGGGAVLMTTHSGESWERLGSGPSRRVTRRALHWTGGSRRASTRTPGQRLLASTDSNVYVSDDLGNTWTDVSAGLPRNPHCAGLEARDSSDSDSTDVYLFSTWGWSLWHANMS